MNRGEMISTLGYFLIALATFAWSASDPRHECSNPDSVNCVEAMDRLFSGVLAGAVWPGYWAWSAAEWVRDHD